MKNSGNEGFTLIELLLAMTLFTAVMMIATVGFIGMSRTFSRGLIRKELSEFSQYISEDVTRAVRMEGPNTAVGPYLGGGGWSGVCFSRVRYLWQPNFSGMFRDNKSCATAVDGSAERILGDRYKVRDFKVTKIEGSNAVAKGLYSVQGVLSTTDDTALIVEEGDIYSMKCKGTSQSASSGSCAVEKFKFVVNSRGAGDESN